MSRSWRASAERCARAVSALPGLGHRARNKQGSGSSDRIGADPPLTPLKSIAVTGTVVLAFVPATALGKAPHRQPSTAQLNKQHTAAPAPLTALGMRTLARGAG